MVATADRYLVRKGNRYWFKRDIPAAIRPSFGGQTAFLKNLETSDIRVAKRRRDEVARDVDRAYRDAFEGSPIDAMKAIREIGETWAAELETSKADPMAWSRKVTGHLPISEEDAVDPGEMIEAEADRIRQRHGADGEAYFLDIVHGRRRVEDPLEEHLGEITLAKASKDERRAIVGEFARWAGKNRIALPSLPRRQAALFFTSHILPLNRKTAGKRLSNLRQYWGWLIERGFAQGENPWAVLKLPADRQSKAAKKLIAERAFSDEEMVRLLSATPAANMRGLETLRDAMKVAALSGLRIEEMVRLTKADCANGAFNIREGKTDNAVRSVPIHSDLVGIVERRMDGKASGERLFSEVRGKGESLSDPLSKQFGRFIRDIGVADLREGHRRSKVNFHSFRRWFATEAEQAGQPPHITSTLLGSGLVKH